MRYAIHFLTLAVICFCLFCGWLVIESGLLECGSTEHAEVSSQGGQPCILLQKTIGEEKSGAENAPAKETPKIGAAESISFTADFAPAQSIILGAKNPETEDPDVDYKFQLELSPKGAAIRKVTFSNGNNNGFDDRDPKNPQPLVVISPMRQSDGSEVLAMANTGFVFKEYELRLLLDSFHWKSFDVEPSPDGSQTARFETTIRFKATNEPVMKLTKTYKVRPGSYLMDCDITVENLSGQEQEVRFDLAGPGGLGKESFRTDMRKVVAGFRDSQGEITSARHSIKDLRKAKTLDKRSLKKNSDNLLWCASVNKYFAGILVPLPDEGKEYCDWIPLSITNEAGNQIPGRAGQFYNPDGDEKGDSGDETIGMNLKIAPRALGAAGLYNSSKTYKFQLYIGPKDKSLFDKNERYHELGFVETIDFLGCCCPSSIIKPLAFGILAIMKWMYGFIGNYGVVIIILVFLMRLIMHPITKKSQVSMSKMQKLAPKAEEIKKKYANNKAEMNKQMMALYKEQGASPIMGFLPMMVQMPIWIALWSAVYTSIDLRGAGFLPFWITDLSMPDAAWTFPTVITIPLIGWKIESLNLLPIMMGVAFYLQQKLMPKQAAASPQVAQQQKMMMIMMPLLFPLMLYKAPSGVNLYIMASTFAGVIEQYVIRKHIREKDEAESKGLVAVTSKTGGKAKKKKPKPFYKNM